jgi:hypothetical protein
MSMPQLEKVDFGALFSKNHFESRGTLSFPLPLLFVFEHNANARFRTRRFLTSNKAATMPDLLLSQVQGKRPTTQFEFPNDDLLIYLSQNYSLIRERPDLIPSSLRQ